MVAEGSYDVATLYPCAVLVRIVRGESILDGEMF